MTEETSTGGCLCGRIKFTTEGPPLWVAHCHCNSCRRSTGAPVTTFVGYKSNQVTFAGRRKFFASSPGVRRGFCDNCGTPMTYEADWCKEEIHFYISLMDEPDKFTPERHVFYDQHISWLELNDDLPQFSGLDREQPASWGPKHSGS